MPKHATSPVYAQAELYCAAFEGPVDDEVDWLLGLCPGVGSVLEPFCGQARYARAFVARGLEYIGVDLEQAMLARAPRGQGITLVRADVTRFDLGRPVDLAYCPINSLCHLADEAAIAAHLACLRRHLPPGAPYVVEIELFDHDGPWHGGPPGRSTWSLSEPGGTEVSARVERVHCDRSTRTYTERATYRRLRGEAVLAEATELFTMRMWTWSDLVRLAADAGFSVERAFTDHGHRGRPEAGPGPQLENDGENHYVLLR